MTHLVNIHMAVLFLLALGVLGAWGAWFVVLFRFDPQVNHFPGLSLFYASLILALTGTTVFGRLLFYHWHAKISASREQVGMITRQAILFAFFVATVLALSAQRLLKWWNIIPLALLALTIELFFHSLTRRPTPYASKPTVH